MAYKGVSLISYDLNGKAFFPQSDILWLNPPELNMTDVTGEHVCNLHGMRPCSIWRSRLATMEWVTRDVEGVTV
jgi:hypothetical protein